MKFCNGNLNGLVSKAQTYLLHHTVLCCQHHLNHPSSLLKSANFPGAPFLPSLILKTATAKTVMASGPHIRAHARTHTQEPPSATHPGATLHRTKRRARKRPPPASAPTRPTHRSSLWKQVALQAGSPGRLFPRSWLRSSTFP